MPATPPATMRADLDSARKRNEHTMPDFVPCHGGRQPDEAVAPERFAARSGVAPRGLASRSSRRGGVVDTWLGNRARDDDEHRRPDARESARTLEQVGKARGARG